MAYTPPGVTVQEFVTPSVAPLLAAPTVVALVGQAQGFVQKTEAITLNDTSSPITLAGVPATATMTTGAIVRVMDATKPELAPNGYISTTDYVFNNANHTITAAVGGAIATAGFPRTVYVIYKYTPADYFLPIRLDNVGDIEDRFGTSFNDSGTGINSSLSYASQIAFENGAQELILMPFFFNNAGLRQQPSNSQFAAASNWADNFVALRDINDINVIVPISGQSMPNIGDSQQLAIMQAAQDHMKFMKTEQQYIVTLLGEDSAASSSVAQMPTLRTHAQTLAARYGGELAEQTVLLSPSKFTRAVPSALGGDLLVGGEYFAAGIAGALAARGVSASLTRKSISGFTSVADFRTKADKNADAAAGLMVVEQKAGLMQIRHSITLDTTATQRRELSIVRAKHRVIESVRDTLETQVIGNVIADGDAPIVVRTAVIGVLDSLRSNGDLVGFSDVQARTLSLDPTAIEVRFSYRPAFPVNYITVGFSIDLTSGSVTPTTSNVDTSSF